MDEWVGTCCLYIRIKSVLYIFKVKQKDMLESVMRTPPVNSLLITAQKMLYEIKLYY